MCHSASATIVIKGVVGDYNKDAVFDSRDYILWRSTATGLAADGNPNGQIDQGDYDAWRSNYDRTASTASAWGGVPEPSGVRIILTGISLILFYEPRRSRSPE